MRVIALGLVLLALAACSGGGGPRYGGPALKRVANPSEILALDIAQSREAQDVGVMRALRDSAADGAITFVPDPVNARDWLSSAEPIPDAAWQPHSVVVSCDGSIGVTTGAIRWGNVDGYYTTVWQNSGATVRQSKWRWVLSHGDRVSNPRIAPEFLQTKVANCDAPARGPMFTAIMGQRTGNDTSDDKTLAYAWAVNEDGSRSVSVYLWNGETFDTVLQDNVGDDK